MWPHLPRMAAVRAGALLIAAAAATLAIATSASGAASHKPPLLGVNISDVDAGSPADADADVKAAAALHATVVRTEVTWSVMQPRAAGENDPRVVAYLDRLAADAAAHHMRLILLVDSVPCWESSAPAALLASCGTKNSRANGWPPKNPADYASLVGFLAGRYGATLAAIEIWNEPDHINERYFAGPEKARKYAELVKLAYPAIKAANPSVAVIAASLVGSNGEFLRALYANGMKGFYDGLAVHYYTLTLASVRSIRRVQLENGDRTPLWLDEFGWSSCYPRERIQAEQACVTEPIQAVDLRDVLRSLTRTSYIAAEVPYRLRDSSTENFGVTTVHGASKPSFLALSRVFSSPFGRISITKLRLRRHRGHVIARGSGPVGDFMVLEASEHGALRYRATFVLDRFNRFKLTLPRVLGTHGLHVRVYQMWAGRRAAARASI
jgi:Cellulase (glycosyl hydrolase family 5)